MKTNTSKILSLLLTLVMLAGLFVSAPVTANAGNTITDTLTATGLGTGGSYSNWSGKSFSSDAVYAGNSMTGTNNYSGAIQMRTSNSNSGIVTTKSGGVAKTISVVWNSSSASGQLDIYGKNSNYTSAANLYNSSASTQGTLLGSVKNGQSTELDLSELENEYNYIGLRSHNGAVYLDSISIIWDTGDDTPTEPVSETEPVKYTITWLNEDGSKIDSTTVNSGVSPTHEAPTKSDDENYSYTFAGWNNGTTTYAPDAELPAATGDASYRATFSRHSNHEEVDVLNRAVTGSTGSSYTNWTGKTKDNTNNSIISDAEYAGNSAGGNSSIQLRSTSPSGIVTTKSGGNARKVTVTWDSHTDGARILQIYGKNTAYGSPEDLYSNLTQGTLLGIIKCSEGTEYTITDNYKYIGLRSASGAMYLAEVDIAWEPEAGSTYTVYWKNGDETLETDSEVVSGATADFNGTNPTDYEEEYYTYTFDGWTIEGGDGTVYTASSFPAVTTNTTFVAHFTGTPKNFTITWLNDDNTQIDTTSVPYGETPAHSDPVKPDDAYYTYTFTGWTPAIASVTGDATYTATYSKVAKNGVVDVLVRQDTGISSGGSYASWQNVSKPSGAVYSGNTAGNYDSIQLRSTNQSGIVTTASGGKALRVTVKWNSSTPEGKTLDIYGKSTPYSSSADLYNTSERGQKLGSIVCGTTTQFVVEGNYAYIGLRSESGAMYLDEISIDWTEMSSYTVLWKNYNGDTLETDEDVFTGDTLSYNGQTPTKPSDAQYHYTFSGWSVENGGAELYTDTFPEISGDITFIAQYSTTLRSYNVVWKNYDGEILETDENVGYGTLPTYNGDTPQKPSDSVYNYNFTGWSPEVTEVDGYKEYTAEFESVPKPGEFTITWKDEDGSVLRVDTVTEGETPDYGEPPTKPGTATHFYNFTGWSPQVVPADGDAEYTAQYDYFKKCIITWNNWDGTLLQREILPEGYSGLKYTGNTPAKELDDGKTYVFYGWSPSVESTVSGDAVYTALFAETTLQFDGIVVMNDEDVYNLGGKYFSYGGVVDQLSVVGGFERDGDNLYLGGKKVADISEVDKVDGIPDVNNKSYQKLFADTVYITGEGTYSDPYIITPNYIYQRETVDNIQDGATAYIEDCHPGDGFRGNTRVRIGIGEYVTFMAEPTVREQRTHIGYFGVGKYNYGYFYEYDRAIEMDGHGPYEYNNDKNILYYLGQDDIDTFIFTADTPVEHQDFRDPFKKVEAKEVDIFEDGNVEYYVDDEGYRYIVKNGALTLSSVEETTITKLIDQQLTVAQSEPIASANPSLWDQYFGGRLLGFNKKLTNLSEETEIVDEESGSLRFMTVLSSPILKKLNDSAHQEYDYGYVFAVGSPSVNINLDNLTVDNPRVNKYSCRNTYNTLSGDFGNRNYDSTDYKYITAGIDDIPKGIKFAARFYITYKGETHYITYPKDGSTGFVFNTADYIK